MPPDRRRSAARRRGPAVTTAFRHVDVDPASPVGSWPYEALVACIERGGVRDWARLTTAIAEEPWGDVARQVELIVADVRPYGVGPLLQRAIERSRDEARRHEGEVVASEVAALVRRSGMSLAALAARLGTSGSRLSTYRSGQVVPSATFMVRLRETVARLDE
nr:helix-turn-helix transcriptional regulator [Janibacter alkaliphilus]